MPSLRTSDFDFDLPEDLIAQQPAEPRDSSRLMVLHRESGEIEHRVFSELREFIPAGDVLVVNRSRVLRARLLGTRASGAPGEVLLLKPLGDRRWEAMVSPGGKLRPGRRLTIAPELEVEILEITERRTRVVRLESPLPDEEAIERFGHVPLPPYIEREDTPSDTARYQTVFAREAGSVAAPTAGLHFTPAVEAALRERGVGFHRLTLHVGAGTFLPVKTEDTAGHRMHSEWGTISAETADALNAARASGGRIVAVGTTSLRLLESATADDGRIAPFTGETAIFITPGYRFRAVDILMTNFHLPRSTLFMLVSAFSGLESMKQAYAHAIAAGYRFYSYGDACLLFPGTSDA
jgi:S-adenosylmethionine:tRNA ribosyltransferase-isomerase